MKSLPWAMPWVTSSAIKASACCSMEAGRPCRPPLCPPAPSRAGAEEKASGPCDTCFKDLSLRRGCPAEARWDGRGQERGGPEDAEVWGCLEAVAGSSAPSTGVQICRLSPPCVISASHSPANPRFFLSVKQE